jgi:hypothetical protein
MDPGKIPAEVFSPAKMVFIGLIVLASLDRIKVSRFEFVWLSVAFLAIEIFHNDYLRIKLNRWAEKQRSGKSRNGP